MPSFAENIIALFFLFDNHVLPNWQEIILLETISRNIDRRISKLSIILTSNLCHVMCCLDSQQNNTGTVQFS